MRPVRIYLDSSDYASFCSESPSEEIRKVEDCLLEQVSSGAIEIGFSWPIINELIQDFDEAHRTNRVKRAETLKRFCGTNAFCYPTEISKGRAFSRDGYWFPDLRDTFDIRAVAKIWIRAIASNKELIPNRSQRNALKNPKLRRKALQTFPQLVDLTQLDLGLIPLTEEFAKGQYLYRFMIGELSFDDANRELLKIVSDPVRYISSWFDMAGKSNTFTEDMRASFVSIEEKLQIAIEAAAKGKEALATLKKLEREMYRAGAPTSMMKQSKEVRATLLQSMDVRRVLKSTDLERLLGPHGLEVLLAYIQERFDPNGMKPGSSDLVDILHAIYLPYCDLWRGDSAFAHMLIKRAIPHADRVVPRLTELPLRISELRVKSSGKRCGRGPGRMTSA